MALDLSVLEKTEQAAGRVGRHGRPLQLLLTDIEEDPNQPRRTFGEADLQELVQSIQLHGIKSPVSVRSHPTKPKKWILNYGARRYRAALRAGHTTIPAFLDEQHTDYQQVIENLQRENLKPLELALFIQKKVQEGVSRAEVARTLAIDAAAVTQHLALIDPPACIETIYTSGACTSPKTLYELRSLHAQFPKEVERWCEQAIDVTRATVLELGTSLRGAPPKKHGSKGIAKNTSNEAVITTDRQLGAFIPGEGSEHSHTNGRRATSRRPSSLPLQLFVSIKSRRAVILSFVENTDPQMLTVQFENGDQMDVLSRSCRLERINCRL